MAFDRRSFLRVMGGGAAIAVAGKNAAAEVEGPKRPKPNPNPANQAILANNDPVLLARMESSKEFASAWVFRYPIDPDAPRLKPPIDVFDIIEARLGKPHPLFYDAKTDTVGGQHDLDQANHAYQCAQHAMNQGWNDEVVTAALLHDLGKAITYEKHCYFSAEMIKPYVSEKLYWITKVHFDIGYSMYPDLNKVPEKARYLFTENNRDRVGLDPVAIKKNPFYLDGTRVRESDDAGRTRLKRPQIIPELRKILGRTFKLSKAGLGYDGEHCDELWKILIEPAWLS